MEIKKKQFLIILSILIVFVFFTRNSWVKKQEYPYQFSYSNDVNQYFCYLPASVVHNSLGFDYSYGDRQYWTVVHKNGKRLPRMTIGMSIMYSPFFLAGHVIAKNTNYKADGYSLPYSISMKIGTYLYVIFGLYLLYLALLYFFNPLISGISIIVTFIGTNLFYYTLVEGEMSHSYLFFLFSIVIYFTIKWHEIQKNNYLFILALTLGMCVLIRPTSIIVVLFPLLYGNSYIEKMALLKNNIKFILGVIPVFLVPIFLQMLFWKIYGDNWFIWSYDKEGFFFNNPHIVDFLFSYRKGWLVYTPLMIIAIIGIFKLKKYIKQMRFSIPIILLLAIYVLSSWWSWWFGGSFGSRVMVEFYAILIFPLAAFIKHISEKKYWNIGLGIVLSFCVFYNVLGNYKYCFWQIHWNSMTKDSYWATFSQIDMDNQHKQTYENALRPPDLDNAKIGKEEREEF